MSRSHAPLALAVVLSLWLAACSSSPTAQPEATPGDQATPGDAASSATAENSGGEAAEGGAGLAALEEVYATVDGLEGEERRETLVGLAEEAGGQVSLYGSTNGDEGPAMIEAFEEATGLSVAFYRASASTILERLLQEREAGFRGADAIFVNGTEMVVLDSEGVLAPLDTPSTADHPEEGVSDNWAWTYVNAMSPLWNTSRISPDRVPTSWEQVLTEYDGELALEIGDADWFATLVGYFMEQGLSEDEALDLFRDAVDGGTGADGHTLMAELVAAGEYGIAASSYDVNARQLVAEGAPVAWEPPVEPLIVRPNGLGISVDTPNPAAALAWVDFMLGEGQAILAEYERTPASRSVEGAGLPEEYEILPVPLQSFYEDRDRWNALYEEIIQGLDVASE